MRDAHRPSPTMKLVEHFFRVSLTVGQIRPVSDYASLIRPTHSVFPLAVILDTINWIPD